MGDTNKKSVVTEALGRNLCGRCLPDTKTLVSERGLFLSCKIDGCTNKIYNKKNILCRNHYVRFLRTGHAESKKEYTLKHNKFCSVEGCINEIYVITRAGIPYCQFHYGRLLNKKDLRLPKYYNKAEKHYMWKGGVAQYKNHSIYKKKRIAVLKNSNYTCYHCGDIAQETHHKDKTKENHDEYNLIAVCRRCHKGIYHRQLRTTSKYLRKYNMRVYEIARKIKMSYTSISRLDAEGKLFEKLNSAT